MTLINKNKPFIFFFCIGLFIQTIVGIFSYNCFQNSFEAGGLLCMAELLPGILVVDHFSMGATYLSGTIFSVIINALIIGIIGTVVYKLMKKNKTNHKIN